MYVNSLFTQRRGFVIDNGVFTGVPVFVISEDSFHRSSSKTATEC